MSICYADSVLRQVWVTDGTHEEKEESPEKWTKVHDAVTHPPSPPSTPDSCHQTQSKSGLIRSMRWGGNPGRPIPTPMHQTPIPELRARQTLETLNPELRARQTLKTPNKP